MLLLASVVFTGACVSLRWVVPPTTAFMRNDRYVPIYQYVPLDGINLNLIAAAVVHEDPAQAERRSAVVENGEVLGRYTRPATSGFLGRRGGTDWRRLLVRAQVTRQYDVDVGGSTTIEQQTVKNLFLTDAKAPWRKVLVEPLMGEVYGLVLPKSKQIELYLNIAEFAPGIWGACAASWYYFDKPPAELTEAEAVDLVAVLPSPKSFRTGRTGGVEPLPAPAGSRYSPARLLAYARKNVPAQIDRDHVLEGLTKAGISPKLEPGPCSTMPAGVAAARADGATQKR